MKSIIELGYNFNKDGELRKLDENGEPSDQLFMFNISNSQQECQEHYELLGAAVTEHVYNLLEEEGLYRLPVPKAPSMNGTFIFATQDYNVKDVLIILIHGSGAVRAGQWARSLIINDNLEKGTQISYIKEAKSREYGVLVMNTNDNFLENGSSIRYSNNAEEHACYVWKEYISNTKASSLVIVAHSYGGIVTLSLFQKFKKDFMKRVKAIALTDSVHSYSNKNVVDYLKKISRNWVSSPEKIDTEIPTPLKDIPRVSAGHSKHEMTSYSCKNSVFKFIESKING